jgi:preprotein translocase subunit YajC
MAEPVVFNFVFFVIGFVFFVVKKQRPQRTQRKNTTQRAQRYPQLAFV